MPFYLNSDELEIVRESSIIDLLGVANFFNNQMFKVFVIVLLDDEYTWSIKNGEVKFMLPGNEQDPLILRFKSVPPGWVDFTRYNPAFAGHVVVGFYDFSFVVSNYVPLYDPFFDGIDSRTPVAASSAGPLIGTANGTVLN